MAVTHLEGGKSVLMLSSGEMEKQQSLMGSRLGEPFAAKPDWQSLLQGDFIAVGVLLCICTEDTLIDSNVGVLLSESRWHPSSSQDVQHRGPRQIRCYCCHTKGAAKDICRASSFFTSWQHQHLVAHLWVFVAAAAAVARDLYT